MFPTTLLGHSALAASYYIARWTPEEQQHTSWKRTERMGSRSKRPPPQKEAKFQETRKHSISLDLLIQKMMQDELHRIEQPITTKQKVRRIQIVYPPIQNHLS
ncbi:hypothetical protein TNCV_2413501 [Trichonephila clavipes]|nr:hypothetical protein TNCV_2413501 [Trichonephila clavipes]